MPVATRTALASLALVAVAAATPAEARPLGGSDPAISTLTLTAADGTQLEDTAPEPFLQPMMLDWFDNRLMQAATATQAPAPKAKTVADEFRAALAAPGGAAKARQIYDETRKKDKTTVIFPEGELNQFGYQVLQEGRAKDAIIIFKMNVDEYPKSANTYDSLSDAYLADGNTAEALKYAEKAIEALAIDTQATDEFKQQVRASAEGKIKQLKKK